MATFKKRPLTPSFQLKRTRTFSRWNNILFRRMYPTLDALVNHVSGMIGNNDQEYQQEKRERFESEKTEDNQNATVVKQLSITNSLIMNSYEESQRQNAIIEKIIQEYNDVNGTGFSLGGILKDIGKIALRAGRMVIGGIRWLANIARSIGVILGEKILRTYRKWRAERVAEEAKEIKEERKSFDEEKDAFEEEKAKYEETKKDIERRVNETEELEKRNTLERDKLHSEQNEFQDNKERFERDMKEVRSNLDSEIKHLEKWESDLKIKENDLIKRENSLKKNGGRTSSSTPDIAEPEIHSLEDTSSSTPKRIIKGPGKPLNIPETWGGFYELGKKLVLPKALKALEIGMIALAIRDMYLKIGALEDNDPKLPQKIAGIVAGVTTRVSVSILYGTAVGIAAGYLTTTAVTAVGGAPIAPAIGAVTGFLVGFGVAYFEDEYAGKTQEDFVRLLIETYPFRHTKTEMEFKQDQLKQIAEEYSHASNEQLKENLLKRSEQVIKDIEYLSKKEEERKIKEDTNLAIRNLTHSISYDPDMTISKLIYEANKISFVTDGSLISNGNNPFGIMNASMLQNGGDYIRKLGKEEIGNAQRVIDFFVSKGWTKEQAAGFAANIAQESNFKTDLLGDHDTAYGIAQWHRDRQENFKKWAHKDIRDSTFDEQLAFMQYELTEGAEKNAGQRIARTKTAGQAAKAIDDFYERSGDLKAGIQKSTRIDRANQYYKGIILNKGSTNVIVDNSKQPKITVPIPAQKTPPTVPTYTPASSVTPNNNYGAPLSERLVEI